MIDYTNYLRKNLKLINFNTPCGWLGINSTYLTLNKYYTILGFKNVGTLRQSFQVINDCGDAWDIPITCFDFSEYKNIVSHMPDWF